MMVWAEENPFGTSAALLARHGYRLVRAEELARAGKMSVGSFYQHHGSKTGYAWQVRQWAESDRCRTSGRRT